MTSPTRRKRGNYKSGHCGGGAPGGHLRCHHICDGVECVCGCHDPELTDEQRRAYVTPRREIA